MEILSMFFLIHNLFSLLFDFLCECITKLENELFYWLQFEICKNKLPETHKLLCEAAQHTVVLGFGLNAKTITKYIIYQIELLSSTCGEFKLL